MLFVMLSFVFFGTDKTMHYNHQYCQWQNLVHIYAVCQYQIIAEIIIWTSVHNMFFSVDCQLLCICIQHRVVPSVLNTAHRVMSMVVNQLHQMFSKTYIQRSFLCWQKVHYGHFVLHRSSSPASGVMSKRWIHVLSVHRDENDSSDNFW